MRWTKGEITLGYYCDNSPRWNEAGYFFILRSNRQHF